MTFLETDRLWLRNVAADDVKTIFDYRNNPLCAQYQRGQTKDLDGIAAMVQSHKDDRLSIDAPCFIAVAQKDTDAPIGEIVVMPSEDTFSLGYTISYLHHRKGYAFEALSALIDLLHRQYPQWEFISFTDPDNYPSMSLLKKLGYTDMGYLPSKSSQVFGKWTTPATQTEIAAFTQKPASQQ